MGCYQEYQRYFVADIQRLARLTALTQMDMSYEEWEQAYLHTCLSQLSAVFAQDGDNPSVVPVVQSPWLRTEVFEADRYWHVDYDSDSEDLDSDELDVDVRLYSSLEDGEDDSGSDYCGDIIGS